MGCTSTRTSSVLLSLFVVIPLCSFLLRQVEIVESRLLKTVIGTRRYYSETSIETTLYQYWLRLLYRWNQYCSEQYLFFMSRHLRGSRPAEGVVVRCIIGT